MQAVFGGGFRVVGHARGVSLYMLGGRRTRTGGGWQVTLPTPTRYLRSAMCQDVDTKLSVVLLPELMIVWAVLRWAASTM